MTRLQADWLSSAATTKIALMFQDAGETAYFVGGCVRNALMGVPVSDLDLSTSVRPDEVTALGKKAGLKVIPTGIEHGTVTVISDGEPFEITTFRKDIATDGRRATVSFSDRMEDDAHRRDFTMNALYAGLDGQVYDPLGGMDDLNARRVRFIDDPVDRIHEDYLRILRFFRFHAWYGDQRNGLDQDALAACADSLDGLAGLSRERIGSEMIKLLSAPDPSTSVGSMEATGVLQAVLPGASGKALFPLIALEFHVDPIARLASLGSSNVADRLRLSKRQERALSLYRAALEDLRSLEVVAYSEGEQAARSVAALRAAVFEQPVPQDAADRISYASQAVFPVAALDLMPDLQGAALGAALKSLEDRWIKSGFTLSKDELLNSLER